MHTAIATPRRPNRVSALLKECDNMAISAVIKVVAINTVFSLVDSRSGTGMWFECVLFLLLLLLFFLRKGRISNWHSTYSRQNNLGT